MIAINDIPGRQEWASITPITAGWSEDEKYKVVTKDGGAYLLRVTAGKHLKKKEGEYNLLLALKDYDIPVSKPVDFGTCDQGRGVYMLLTWVEGQEAIGILPGLDDKTQYQLGVLSGQILKVIHSIDHPRPSWTWADRYNRKIDGKLKSYLDCGLEVDGFEQMIHFIQQNRHLLADRPITFQHGDYHIGNMVLDGSNQLGVVDFNRLDLGDPWEEFNRITWCAYYSPLFATGRIDGYFDGDIPDDFFRLLAVYIGANQLSSIPWAKAFGQEEVDNMVEQAKLIVASYDRFQSHIPKWYDSTAFERFKGV